MNRLIKPQKQSYTGEDAQVLAYARDCEIAWSAKICVGLAIIRLGFTGSPVAALSAADCAIVLFVRTMACNPYI